MARDFVHDACREALEKDGWFITHDPYIVPMLDTDGEIDLGAEKFLAAQRTGGDEMETIAVEIKSFMRLSMAYEFHSVLGQYLNYKVALRDKDPKRVLYLPIPRDAYNSFFERKSVDKVLTEFGVKLIVFSPETKKIETWILH
jgi:XisH protein